MLFCYVLEKYLRNIWTYEDNDNGTNHRSLFSFIVCTFFMAYKMFTVGSFSPSFVSISFMPLQPHTKKTHFAFASVTRHSREETKSNFNDESMKFNARNLFAEKFVENTFFFAAGCCFCYLVGSIYQEQYLRKKYLDCVLCRFFLIQ